MCQMYAHTSKFFWLSNGIWRMTVMNMRPLKCIWLYLNPGRYLDGSDFMVFFEEKKFCAWCVQIIFHFFQVVIYTLKVSNLTVKRPNAFADKFGTSGRHSTKKSQYPLFEYILCLMCATHGQNLCHMYLWHRSPHTINIRSLPPSQKSTRFVKV